MRETKLSGTNRVIQLLEYCTNQLWRVLTQNAGGTLIGKMENEVLAAIKTLTVREENALVAIVTLHKSIHPYGARLQGQEGVCRFTQQCANCNADVDYTEAI